MHITHDYKVQKSVENVDRESVKRKYEDILALMQEALPPSTEEARESDKEYPFERGPLTKLILSTKLKYMPQVHAGRQFRPTEWPWSSSSPLL